MRNSAIKSVRITAWICVALCVLMICYGVYSPFRYPFDEFRSDPWRVCHHIIYPLFDIMMSACLIVFCVRILRKISEGMIFVRNNHRWIIVSVISYFVGNYLDYLIASKVSMGTIFYQGLWTPLSFLISPLGINMTMMAFLMLIFAFLYRLGEKAAEEQRLTI